MHIVYEISSRLFMNFCIYKWKVNIYFGYEAEGKIPPYFFNIKSVTLVLLSLTSIKNQLYPSYNLS